MLLTTYGHVIIATGSWGRSQNPSEGGEHVIDALDLLWGAFNEEGGFPLGKRVAVIGAGDVAMDCVRTAVRTPGVEESLIVYRRNEPNMPATQHEVNTVRAEGLTMLEAARADLLRRGDPALREDAPRSGRPQRSAEHRGHR